MQKSELQRNGSLLAQLRVNLRGEVLAPGDAAWEGARRVYFTAMDRHPAAIVRVADVGDVVRVVGLARDAGATVAVRSGGHSLAGHGVADGAIVVDMAGLRDLAIDPSARVARAGGGVTAGAYTEAAGAHGLATGFGDAATVGIAGITLAGGIGFLHRRFGMTIDNLLSAELVTADGRVLEVDAEREPDLFWAIRGGGGNFGVVTRLEYRLQEVAQVLGGMLILPATAERIVSFLELALAAPDELSLIMMMMPAPPASFIPAEQHGRPILMATLVYAGDLAEGERVVAPLRAVAPPIADLVRPMRYPEIYHSAEEPPHPAAMAFRTGFLDGLELAGAEALLAELHASPGTMRVVQFRPLGGALARVPAQATAFAHRARRCMVNIASMHQDPARAPEHEAWVARVAGGIGLAADGAYVAFLGTDGAARIGEAYPPETYERLRAVKRRYDPANLFRHNQNVAP